MHVDFLAAASLFASVVTLGLVLNLNLRGKTFTAAVAHSLASLAASDAAMLAAGTVRDAAKDALLSIAKDALLTIARDTNAAVAQSVATMHDEVGVATKAAIDATVDIVGKIPNSQTAQPVLSPMGSKTASPVIPPYPPA